MTNITKDVVADFLKAYSEDVRDLAGQYRRLIKKKIPGINEQVDASARIIGFGFGQKYSDLICTLIPSKKGLKLGFYKGSELPDPKELLTGKGKIHRHINLSEDTDASTVGDLLDHAFNAYKARKK